MTQSRKQRLQRLERLEFLYSKGLELHPDNADAKLMEETIIHATNLAVLHHFGKPQIGEPLSVVWERCEPDARRVRNDMLNPFDEGTERMMGMTCRLLIVPNWPGSCEKEKLALVLATAPAWLLWFTFYDVTAGALDLPVPDFSSVRKFARSAMTFKRYPALPRGAFECKPWPGGSDDEPITAEEKELLRKRLIGLDAQMTPRERRRALDLFLQSPEDMPGYKQRPWPKLP